MSPYEIKLLLDIYAIANWQEGRNEPILYETLDSFHAAGLITTSTNYHSTKITRKGRAHVIQLCNLLYPVEQNLFVDQFGNKIPDTI